MSDDIPAPTNSNRYLPDQIILYGVKINRRDPEARIPLFENANTLFLEVRNNDTGVTLGIDEIAMAVIYGYAYEGHCYRLDRPKLMIFEYDGGESEANGCGFFGPDYRMWRISKKKKLLELNTNLDTAEVLILDANLPGNRAPNTYGNSVALAHRGGRISRGGGGSPV
jgi:hypothetical protein